MMSNKIAIIGGGASGMMASISAARSGAQVTIFEANEKIGKKILVTGNGRCNLTNIEMNAKYYSCDNLNFVTSCLENFSTKETIDFFKSIGVLVKEKNGGIYPVTENASTILDALRFALVRYKVNIICGTLVKKIDKKNNKFIITGCDIAFDKVIVATGLYAGKNKTGARQGIELAKNKGHDITKILPALVQLQCEGTYFKSIAGVRTTTIIKSYSNGKFLKQESGELQLTNYGLSGIPIFQLSSDISKELDKKNKVTVLIDFLPWIKEEDITSFVTLRKGIMPNANLGVFLNGILHKNIIQIALKSTKLATNDTVNKISDKKIITLLNVLKNWEVKVLKTNSFDQAQVCTGGINLNNITPFFESKIEANLYFIGEMLNVDGICGGYNLQWAWTSGSIAGSHAALS